MEVLVPCSYWPSVKLIGLPDSICQRQENVRENLNGLESTNPQPESNGPTNCRKQPADRRRLHLGDRHLHGVRES